MNQLKFIKALHEILEGAEFRSVGCALGPVVQSLLNANPELKFNLLLPEQLVVSNLTNGNNIEILYVAREEWKNACLQYSDMRLQLLVIYHMLRYVLRYMRLSWIFTTSYSKRS